MTEHANYLNIYSMHALRLFVEGSKNNDAASFSIV